MTKKDAAAELLKRRKARTSLKGYISYVNPNYIHSKFSDKVCASLDQFIEDMQAGIRPVLVLNAPPQHGKSEIVSRNLPAYLMGRFPDWFISAASYSSGLAGMMSLAVRRILASDAHRALFPHPGKPKKLTRNANGEFHNPTGNGAYLGDGVGGGFTGRTSTVFILDDVVKNASEALSPAVKEGHWNWYQSTCKTRMSANSGLIVMATAWSGDDLRGRILNKFQGDPRLTVLRFPAINLPGEVGYDPKLPEGALVPELHPLEQLREAKAELSDYWWSAIYQQSPKPLGGNIFKEEFVQYWLPKDLPEKFDKMCASWDCTFKDTKGTDFVVGQIWGKRGANSYLLAQVRARMSFTKTLGSVEELHNDWPRARAILIEDKANGPAVIDTLKSKIPGILPIEPDGSKLARGHAVSSYWEARNIWLPHPDLYPWVKDYVSEITTVPAAPNDDQFDATTQALRWLYPLVKMLKISKAAIQKALKK